MDIQLNGLLSFYTTHSQAFVKILMIAQLVMQLGLLCYDERHGAIKFAFRTNYFGVAI